MVHVLYGRSVDFQDCPSPPAVRNGTGGCQRMVSSVVEVDTGPSDVKCRERSKKIPSTILNFAVLFEFGEITGVGHVVDVCSRLITYEA